MERLSGVGAVFLAVETPTNPMHVATLALLDGSAAPGFGFAAVRRLIEGRLHLLAPLRRRVVEVPFGLGRPVVADDPRFVLDDHLHRAALPAPGGPSDLAAVVAGILATPLPRDRPLWELHVVEGLEDGRVAVVAKMHHAVVDGVAGAALLLRLFDVDPHPPPPPADAPPWAPEPLPAPADLLAGAMADLAGAPEAVVRAARRTLAAASAHAGPRPVGPPAPALFSAPRTPFNAALTSRRVVAWSHLPLDAVKRVKQAFGCKVNDVVLAVCASALRAHLAGQGRAPARDLVALVPLALAGPPADGAGSANRLAPVLVSLATTVDDPVERLRAIAACAAEAKAREGPLGPGVVQEWADAAVPAVTTAAARVVAGLRLAERLPPACNVIVSNVPGPPFPLYMAGAPVEALVPFGPLADGVALNVTVLSHAGSLHAGVVADRAAVPDVDGVAGLLAPALGELEAAGRRGGRC